MIIEKPGAQIPWAKINQLLAPDERFEVHSPQWEGLLLAPRHPSQLAALLYLLRQEEISVCVQGRGTHFLPTAKHSVVVSTRAFSQVFWHEQGVVEVGAGCSLSHLHQFLFERNQEVALGEDFLDSSKRSIAAFLLSCRTTSVCDRAELLTEALLGMEFVTWEGSQVKWGGRHRSAVAGPALHKLVWGLQAWPGVIVKVFLKTFFIPPVRLQLTWTFRQKEDLWKQFHELKQFSSTWEYLDVVLSGKSTDQGFIFAQISGLPEEMKAFSQLCPGYATASQQGEKLYLKKFFIQQKLNFYSVVMDHPLEFGEYLWVQDWRQEAWLLTSRVIKENVVSSPIWKQRIWMSCE